MSTIPAPLPDATPTVRGAVNTIAQTFSGSKGLSGSLSITGALTASNFSGVSSGINTGDDVSSTKSSLVYYVANSGGDLNDGLTPGTAFSTISKALSMIPTVVKHLCTINLAAGSYDEKIVFQRLLIDKSVVIQGADMIAPTLTSGILSGTFDASFGTQEFPHVALVSSGGWTTDDLLGNFAKITSGSLSGSTFPIVANTSTTVSFGMPVNSGNNLQGLPFQIVKPASLISCSSSTTIATIMNCFGSSISNDGASSSTADGRAQVNFDKVQFSLNTSGAGNALLIYGGSAVNLTNCCVRRLTGTETSSTTINNGFVSITDSIFINSAITVQNLSVLSLVKFCSRMSSQSNNIQSLSASIISVTTGAYIFNTNNSFGYANLAYFGISGGAINSVVFKGPTSTSINMGLYIKDRSNVTVTNCYFKNLGSAINTGDNGVSQSSTILGGSFDSSNPVIDSCARGIALGQASICALRSGTISNCTSFGIDLGFNSKYSSNNNVALLSSSQMVFSGNAVDMTLDGSTPLSITTLRSLIPPVASDLIKLNRISET